MVGADGRANSLDGGLVQILLDLHEVVLSNSDADCLYHPSRLRRVLLLLDVRKSLPVFGL